METLPSSSSPPRCMLAIVARDPEITLRCLTTILNIQILVMTKPVCSMELVVVKTANEALNAFRSSSADALLYMSGDAGVDHNFLGSAFESGESLIVGVSALPYIDWERSKAAMKSGSSEPPEYSGIVYNVKTAQYQEGQRYVDLEAVADVHVMFVRRSVVDALAAGAPSDALVDFALDTIIGGKFIPGIPKFLDSAKRSCKVVADVDHQVTISAPFEFAGSVGARTALR